MTCKGKKVCRQKLFKTMCSLYNPRFNYKSLLNKMQYFFSFSTYYNTSYVENCATLTKKCGKMLTQCIKCQKRFALVNNNLSSGFRGRL